MVLWVTYCLSLFLIYVIFRLSDKNFSAINIAPIKNFHVFIVSVLRRLFFLCFSRLVVSLIEEKISKKKNVNIYAIVVFINFDIIFSCNTVKNYNCTQYIHGIVILTFSKLGAFTKFVVDLFTIKSFIITKLPSFDKNDFFSVLNLNLC